jgi:hypothetical protein
MSAELMLMEAALFQLRAVVGNDPDLLPIRLSVDVLANAVSSAKEHGINTARVNDIEFALNDLLAAIDDAGAPNELVGPVVMLQNDTATLRAATALPKELVTAIRALQTKLRARASAMERGQYRIEGAPEVTLPHAPEELREEAIPLARQLAAAGFETPSLDTLITDHDSLRYHTLNEIVDELDVVLGG